VLSEAELKANPASGRDVRRACSNFSWLKEGVFSLGWKRSDIILLSVSRLCSYCMGRA